MKIMISIIYVYYNTPSEIIKSVYSVRKTVGKMPYEIIIVDNNSPKKIPKELIDAEDTIIIHNKSNVGYGAGLNNGARKAHGEYLILANPDTVFQKDAIGLLIAKLKSNKSIGIVAPKLIDKIGNWYRNVSKFPFFANIIFFSSFHKLFPNNPISKRFLIKDFSSDKEKIVDVVGGACMGIRKTIYEKVGGFDEQFFMYFEESDFCYRIGKLGYKVVYFPKAQVIHLGGRSTDDSTIVQNYFEKSRFLFMKKYHGFLYALTIESLLRFTTSLSIIIRNPVVGVFVGLFVFIIIVASLLPGILFPADILQNLPSYSTNHFIPPKNSLLADPVFQFEPWRYYAKNRLLHGEFPLWNDQNGNGSPFFANPQTAVLFPLNMLYYLFPITFSLNVIPLLKLYFFGLFTYLYLRSIKCSRDVSFLGAFIASFSGFILVWILWPHTNVFVFLPLFLFLTEKIKSNHYKNRYLIFLSISYCFAYLGGHPETLLSVMLVHGAYVLFRFWKNWKDLLMISLFILAGLSLCAVQLFPFIEYLINSYALHSRAVGSIDNHLPLFTSIFNIFPFLLGAPHTAFYRPYSPLGNFQEAVGGYIGAGVLAITMLGIIRVKKNSIMLFWLGIILVSFFLSYDIWPISFITNHTFIHIIPLQRYIGIAGFGIVILFSLILQNYKEIRYQFISHHQFKYISYFSLILIPLIWISPVVISHYYIDTKIINFSLYLRSHIIFIYITTFIVLFLFHKYVSITNNKKLYFLGLCLLILSQSMGLFWNYNPLVTTSLYYPNTKVIEALKSLPTGITLDVGNPAIVPNINLIYNLVLARNDDALEIEGYRNEFDKTFPSKTQWKTIDNFLLPDLQKFGVKYVISDYNPNLKRVILQNDHTKLLLPLSNNTLYKYSFVATEDTLSEIRIITANYNRLNTCTLVIKVIEPIENQIITKEEKSCQTVKDNMFFVIPLPDSPLVTGKKYMILISVKNSQPSNTISLWGNKSDEPYIELFYATYTNSPLTLLSDANGAYIWNIPSQQIDTNGTYARLLNEPERKIFTVHMYSSGYFELKQPYYPGWEAWVNGGRIEITDSKPFQKIYLSPGDYFVEFVYRPYSFYLGLIVSLSTMLMLGIYTIRKERKYINILISSIRIKAQRTSALEHVLIIGILLTLTILLYSVIVRYLPVHFLIRTTTAINWLTINQYPKQQDSFYFYTGFIFITLTTGSLWLLWIRLKK